MALEKRIDRILKSESSVFENRVPIVKYAKDAAIIILGKETSDFQTVQAERKKERDSFEFEDSLYVGNGCRLANIGVSALITTEYKGNPYLVGVKAGKDNPMAKLLSGYVPAEQANSPEKHLMKEISQEFLPTAQDEFIQGALGMELLEKPFEKEFYSRKYRFNIWFGCDFELPPMKRKVIIRDELNKTEKSLEENIGFFATRYTNSGQLIFKYKFILPECGDLSLNHSEDEFNQETKMLDTKFHEEGILLFELNKENRMTGSIFTLNQGKLKQYNKSPEMIEAFSPRLHAINLTKDTSFENYLKFQR
jgi:hypothetical protein